jgi:hypothetical protein
LSFQIVANVIAVDNPQEVISVSSEDSVIILSSSEEEEELMWAPSRPSFPLVQLESSEEERMWSPVRRSENGDIIMEEEEWEPLIENTFTLDGTTQMVG